MELRLKNLRNELNSSKIDALLVSSPVNILYLTGCSNFSKDEREAYLLITAGSATLFTDARYIEAVEKILPKGIKATTERISKKLNQIVKHEKIKTVGFEKNLTFEEYDGFKKLSPAKLKITDNLVEKLRAVKDEEEISAMKKAAKLTSDTFDYIVPLIKPGVREKETAFEMEMYIKKYGGTLAFESIVAFGSNSSVPHHLTSDKKLSKKDEFVLLDFGAKVDGYCSDMTRTLLTKGGSSKAKSIYQAVLDAQDKAAHSIVPNKKDNAQKAGKLANEILKKHGFNPVPHGLGHGIGIEVHEIPHLYPNSEDTLVPGNYFSIEPGIYIPGFGGVRIEDDYLLDTKGIKQLTTATKTLIEI